jgi:hypothetical protein
LRAGAKFIGDEVEQVGVIAVNLSKDGISLKPWKREQLSLGHVLDPPGRVMNCPCLVGIDRIKSGAAGSVEPMPHALRHLVPPSPISPGNLGMINAANDATDRQ